MGDDITSSLSLCPDHREELLGCRRLCDEAKPGQILISPRVLMAVEDAVKVEPVGEFALKGIRRPLAAYKVLAPVASTF